MQGLTYLKRLEQKKSRAWWPLIVILLIIYTLAIWAWAYGNGLSEGIARVNATVEKAAGVAFDAGMEKGLDALEVGRKRKK